MNNFGQAIHSNVKSTLLSLLLCTHSSTDVDPKKPTNKKKRVYVNINILQTIQISGLDTTYPLFLMFSLIIQIIYK